MSREDIVAEITRLAKEAGDRPPGKLSFAKATGIQESAWSGKFWARWSDALREAGFEANHMQKRFGTDDVLTAIIAACRHYGHVPTVAELKLYGRIHPSFPSKGAVANHFPDRAALLRALAARAVSNSTYLDVGAMIADDVQPVPIAPQAKRGAEGHVYLLRSGNFYKIGRSENIERRVKEVRVALPEAVTLVHVIETDDPSGIEAYWHRRFCDKRRNGEWFALTVRDVTAFRRRRFQ